MSNIRVTYSGLIAFATSIGSTITGLFFIVIVTRQLIPEDFGLWTLIGSLVSYVAIIQPIVTYWTTRQIARGEAAGKTALFSGGLLSVVGFTIYSIIAITVSATMGVSLFILMLAAILVPLNFLNTILNSISLGFRPQNVSYGLLAFEFSKLPLGFILVYIGQLGIIGVLLTIIIAHSLRIIFLVILTREKIVGTIKREFLKFWIRMSWLTLYQSVSAVIQRLDVLIFSMITNSLIGLAFWGASLTIGNIVTHAAKVSQGLYPKIIESGKKEYAEDNLQKTFFFAIPIFAASIVFAKSGLHILNPIYADSIYIVFFLASTAFVNSLKTIFFQIIAGYESIDIDKQASFRQYIKSSLFLIPTLQIIFSVLYIISLSIFLFLFWTSDMSEIFSVTVWALIMFVVSIPFMIYSFILVKKKHKIKMPIKSIGKFCGVALLSSIITYSILDNFVTYYQSIWDFIPEILPVIFLGAAIYFGTLYFIDSSTRKFYKAIINGLVRK